MNVLLTFTGFHDPYSKGLIGDNEQKEAEELCKGNFDFYIKSCSVRGEGKMLSDLWYKIQNSDEATILNEHSEIFRVFDGNACYR